MAERLPYELFDRPLALPTEEAPRMLNRRPNHEAVIKAYNSGLDRLLQRGEGLEQRRQNGDFNRLSEVATKSEAGQPLTVDEQLLIRDFGTLLDARDARFGRRNLNSANLVAQINRDEAAGRPLSAVQDNIRKLYQHGSFHLIEGVDGPLPVGVTETRFVLPVTENDHSMVIFDGGSVEGIIRNLTREIAELQARTDIAGWRKSSDLRALRQERDVLFTSSTDIYAEDNELTHARRQYEAKLKSEDPILAEWHQPDWFKRELSLLEHRLVVDIPERGRDRWCLPLGYLPLLIAVPLLINLCRPVEPPVLPPPPLPPVGICSDIPGGRQHFEVFDISKLEGKEPFIKGAIEREMGFESMKRAQDQYLPADDEGLNTEVARLYTDEPDFVEEYMEIAWTDYGQTASRTLGITGPLYWLYNVSEFPSKQMLVGCKSSAMRFQEARAAVEARKTS